MRTSRMPDRKVRKARLAGPAVFLLLVLTAGTLALAPVSASSQPAGTPLSDRIGVAASHLKLRDDAAMEKELQGAAEAGAGWVRFDFAWVDLEPQRGTWDFSGADAAVEKARSRGVKVLGILGAAPPWANGDRPFNFPPTDVDAWKKYVSTVTARYRGRVSAWELWNEQNIHAFWMPPNPEAYVALMRPAAAAVRAADPAATIVLGGVAGLDPSFLDGCLRAGAADFVDAIALHPYPETLQFLNYTPQEANCRYVVDFLKWMISRYTSRPIEIWITEFGWTTSNRFPQGVDQSTQAAYMLRSMVNYAGTSVDKVFWYCLWDMSADPGDPESNYGLLANDFTKKPSWHYFKRFEELFGGAVSESSGIASFSCSRPGTLEAHAFELPDGNLSIAAWKTDDLADTLELRLKGVDYGDPLMVDPMTGQSSTAPGAGRDPAGNVVVTGLPVGKTPLLLKIPNGSCRVASMTPGQSNQFTPFVNVELAGSGFRPGAQVGFKKGASVLQAYNVKVVSADRISCNVGFFLVEPGSYDAVVTNPDGSQGCLPGAVNVKRFWW